MYRLQIEAEAKARTIKYLVHFTQVSNLPSIAKNGLLPVAQARSAGFEPQINDHLRLDGFPNANSVSIAFPNYRMFYRCRRNTPGANWAVLAIQPSVLWTRRCAFCKHNAADARVTSIPIDQRASYNSFLDMYDDPEGARIAEGIGTCDPTDVQAEVLVFDTIPPSEIFCVVFDDLNALNQVRPKLTPTWNAMTHAPGAGLFAQRAYARRGGFG